MTVNKKRTIKTIAFVLLCAIALPAQALNLRELWSSFKHNPRAQIVAGFSVATVAVASLGYFVYKYRYQKPVAPVNSKPILSNRARGSVALSAHFEQAMSKGDIVPLASYVREGGNINALIDSAFSVGKKVTVLQDAVMSRNIQLTEWLLDNGADIESQCPWCTELSPLFIAIENDDVAMVTLLLDRNADIEEHPKIKITPLLYALEQDLTQNNLRIVQLLLEKGSDPAAYTNRDIPRGTLEGAFNQIKRSEQRVMFDTMKALIRWSVDDNRLGMHRQLARLERNAVHYSRKEETEQLVAGIKDCKKLLEELPAQLVRESQEQISIHLPDVRLQDLVKEHMNGPDEKVAHEFILAMGENPENIGCHEARKKVDERMRDPKIAASRGAIQLMRNEVEKVKLHILRDETTGQPHDDDDWIPSCILDRIVKIRDATGYALLSYAVYWGKDKVIQGLLDAGASLDDKTIHGQTAYMIADQQLKAAKDKATAEKYKAIKDILNHHRAKREEVKLAKLKAAEECAKKEEADALIEFDQLKRAISDDDANVFCSESMLEKKGSALLLHAAKFGRTAIVEGLLKQKVSVDKRDEEYYTALMAAAINGNVETVAVLLKRMTPEHIKMTLHGKTAYELVQEAAAKPGYEQRLEKYKQIMAMLDSYNNAAASAKK